MAAALRAEADRVHVHVAELPEERRTAIDAVRRTILKNLPEGYEEAMNWGMISYQVPLDTYPETYNGQPLMYAALASQKNYMAVYLTGIYMSESSRKDFEKAYKATGKRLDAGKSCVRFRKLDDLPLRLIGDVIAATSVDALIARVEEVHKPRKPKGRRSG